MNEFTKEQMHDEPCLIFENPHPVYLHLNKGQVPSVQAPEAALWTRASKWLLTIVHPPLQPPPTTQPSFQQAFSECF